MSDQHFLTTACRPTLLVVPDGFAVGLRFRRVTFVLTCMFRFILSTSTWTRVRIPRTRPQEVASCSISSTFPSTLSVITRTSKTKQWTSWSLIYKHQERRSHDPTQLNAVSRDKIKLDFLGQKKKGKKKDAIFYFVYILPYVNGYFMCEETLSSSRN